MKSNGVAGKPKVFVYDTSRGFSRFIKSQYGNQFEIDVCSYPVRFREKAIEKGIYDFAFININSYEDLSVFVALDGLIDHIFVSSPLLDVKRLLPKYSKVVLLDSTLLRRDTVKIINSNVALIKLEMIV